MTDTQIRGYRVFYYGAETHCPSCQASSWLVGRRLAECARCGCAIPIAPKRSMLAVGAGVGAVGATATILGWAWWRRRAKLDRGEADRRSR